MTAGQGAAGHWWPETEERIVGEGDDMTRPLQPVQAQAPDPTGLGEINWPKAFVIVGVTLIVVLGLITIAALIFLPAEFWTMPQ